jgi:phosphoglycolate phosphatase
MPVHGPRPLLLDLDGTLIDSRQDLAAGVNLLLEELGLPPLPLDEVCSYIGRGARSLIRRSLDAADPGRTVPRDAPVLRGFLAHYSSVILDTTVPFPGVVAGLDVLKAAGVPMAVVTNKPIEPARVCLDGLGLTGYFGAVLGGDSLSTKKPDGAPLAEAARLLGVELDRCLMVGDSDVDIDAASSAGIEGVWCAWGGIHPDRPRGPCLRVDRFDEVVQLSLERGFDSPPSGSRRDVDPPR